MKRTLKSMLSAAAAAAMAFSTLAYFPYGAFRVSADEVPDYLALGDSISTGYGLADATEEGFVYRVASELGYNLCNAAVNGNTAEGIFLQLADGGLDDEIMDAELITLTCGGNDLMGVLYEQIAVTYNASEGTAVTAEEVLASLAAGESTYTWTAMSVLRTFSESDTFRNALSGYTENLTAVMTYIREVNPGAEVILCTQYNPYQVFKGTFLYHSVYTGIEAGVLELNQVIAAKAPTLDYTAVDVYQEFADSAENLCNAQITPLNLDFHPNAGGHALMSDTVMAALRGETKYVLRQTEDFQILKETVAAAEAGDQITVTGTAAVSETVELSIPDGVNVYWAASLSGSTSEDNAALLQLHGTEQAAFIMQDGGSIHSSGSGGAIGRKSGSTVSIILNGGSISSPVTETEGIDSVISGSATFSEESDALVIGWKLPVDGTPAYGIGDMADIQCWPSDASVMWDSMDGTAGISYSHLENTGFFKVEGAVVKAVPTAEHFTVTFPADAVYDGAEQTVSVETASGMGEYTVRYYTANDQEVTAPVNAGTYRVRIDTAEGMDFIAASGVALENWTFVIKQAVPEVQPTISQRTYTAGNMIPEISLPTGSIPGAIRWVNPPELLAEGENELAWEFIPEDAVNYTETAGIITVHAEAASAETATSDTTAETEETVTTTAAEPALPQTGTASAYRVLIAAAAILTVLGGLAVIRFRVF